MEKICPKCNDGQYTIQDQKYLEVFEHCWCCDQKEWREGRLTIKELVLREKKVYDLMK